MPTEFFEKRFDVVNKLGLHARPAALLVATARKFDCQLVYSPMRDTWDSAGMMQLMTLGVPKGSRVKLGVIGEDAAKCMAAFDKLFKTTFVDLDEGRESESVKKAYGEFGEELLAVLR